MLLSVNVRDGKASYGSGLRDISRVVVRYDCDHDNNKCGTQQITLTDKDGSIAAMLIFHAPGDMDKFVTDLANMIGEGGEEMAI